MSPAQKKMLAELRAEPTRRLTVTGRRERPVIALKARGLIRIVREWGEGGELGISPRWMIEVALTGRGFSWSRLGPDALLRTWEARSRL